MLLPKALPAYIESMFTRVVRDGASSLPLSGEHDGTSEAPSEEIAVLYSDDEGLSNVS